MLVVALLVATAAAFALTEGLKLEQSPIFGTRVTKVFSPALGGAEISFRLRKADTVRVSLVDGAGDVVRTLVDRHYGTGRVTVVWDGRDDDRNVLPEGAYKPRVHLSGARRTIELPNPIRVDTAGPEILRSDVSPLAFSPDGDGRADRIIVRYRLDEPGRMLLYVSAKRRVRTRFARKEDALRWYGIVDGKPLRAGSYPFMLRAIDPAGNLGAPVFGSLRIRYVEVPEKAIRTVAGTRFRIQVDADARTVRWRFAGGTGKSEPGLLSLRAPSVPGEYTLYVSVGKHAAKATVAVEPRG